MPSKHARLSPSAAERWINCPGSVRIGEMCPPEPASSYADEGTAAHALAELKVRRLTEAVDVLLFDWARGSEYYCGEMEEATNYYAEQVQLIWAGALQKDPSAELMVEQHFSLSDWVPGGFGTSDAVVIGAGVIEVIDLKYGKGVKVEAKGNPQLRLYGLGAAHLFSDVYDIQTVRMTIIQPRLDHVSTEEMALSDLYAWADEVVRPAAEEAAGKHGHTESGEWCRWCPAKAVCRTRAEKQFELAAYEFTEPELLSSGEIGDILIRAEELQKWTADVQAYALQAALEGEHFDGWKLVEGRAVRKYADELKVADVLQAAGYPEAALYERKLLGLTAMEKLVGKKKLTETLGDLIVKPAGKPVLVPESDKRPPISTTEAAKSDFSS